MSIEIQPASPEATPPPEGWPKVVPPIAEQAEERNWVLKICDVRDKLKSDLDICEQMLQIALAYNKNEDRLKELDVTTPFPTAQVPSGASPRSEP